MIPPASHTNHTHTFIILHGRGSNAEKFGLELLESARLSVRLPTVKFVFPTASKRRSTALKRTQINQWFDNSSLEDPRERPDLQIEGLCETAEFIRLCVDTEADILGEGGHRRVILGGLSQGCAAGIFTLLGGGFGLPHGETLGGFVGMSGWLPFEAQLTDITTARLDADYEFDPFASSTDPADESPPALQAINHIRDILDLETLTLPSGDPMPTVESPPASHLLCPVFLGHGTDDSKVPVKLGQRMADFLSDTLHMDVTWRSYEGFGHWYKVPHEIDDIVHFLKEKVGSLKSRVLSIISLFFDFFHLDKNNLDMLTISNLSDFYRYTGGRWLWDEEAQLQKRYKRFNVPELKRIAAQSVGAKSCTSITKHAQGSWNKVFELTMDNGVTVIARLPIPMVGPPFRTTASEVATMDFARSVLDIPAPKVIAWSGTADNPVESEYIILGKTPGTELHQTWVKMELEDKLKIVDEIISIQKKFLSASFTRYGHLYFAEDAFPGCEKAQIVGDVSESQKQLTQDRYVIGPVACNYFWDEERASMNIDRGPWRCPQNYLKATARREIDWITKYASPRPPPNPLVFSKSQHSPDAHIDLYKKFLDVADFILPTKQEHVRSTLWYSDFRVYTIFVDGTRITCLVDWQNIWARPLFMQAQSPKLFRIKDEVLELPKEYEEMTDEDEKAELRNNVETSKLQRAYHENTKIVNPDIHDVLHNIPRGDKIRQTIALSTDTWNDDIIPFRMCLIWIARYWHEICPHVPCPIEFTEEELKSHHENADDWNAQADFWELLDGTITPDGWVYKENYDTAMDIFAHLKTEMLKDSSITEERRADIEKQLSWVVVKEEAPQENRTEEAIS
ncbi:uncharacterized protein GIQ15_00730 [Arthroderma uncinatum]|uniref:uncharacterized protein n=1 Tax=Arthroderma uncinatum TaxID=74035 RepID=UPI00144AD576|nr:uncharacterized protein GIQ15_00730 [Arthroderma uncinatum]KAF3491213.1 hypothetical protein GIQ15_00730 [Arthroderma uncinatum]